MNGGKLIQNVSRHGIFGTHEIIAPRNLGDRYDITSTHHQMQYPFDLEKDRDYKVLYFASRRSEYYEGDGVGVPPCEPEIVLYTVANKPLCLAIQGHPEMMRTNAPVWEMLNRLVDKYLC